ncbi:MAG: undecaprenyl-phosphate glucose phosphotransferase [Candidatus Marinimicrobia bacterium]|nr:undecaprenyl-phosphate glucose phosphotransferase [Candidatus Neomarinimicrobiota bacterium]
MLSDFLAINLAFILVFIIRFKSGAYQNEVELLWQDVPLPALFMSFYWMVIFAFNQFYVNRRVVSRSDEVLNVVKYTFLGILVLYFITIDLSNPVTFGKAILLFYWFFLMFFVALGRLIIRTAHRRLLAKGIGRAASLIVGWNRRGWELLDNLLAHPAAGNDVLGFVTLYPEKNKGQERHGIKVLGGLDDLPGIIRSLHIEDVILALDKDHHSRVLDIIARISDEKVSLKISPDLSEAISGTARTQQLYGLPLVEIMPEIMPYWERVAKRVMDILFSGLALVILSPLFLIVAAGIKLESKGPVFYTQDRAGRRGRPFRVIKFRSMVEDAESETGPVWAQRDDPRVTRVGKVLRFLRLDEFPQFINVLKGEMSLVGPRPERPYFVEQIQRQLPLYTRRHRVKPGITGWAQVKWGYDESLEDVRQKLKFDLFYIENMSLRLDLKIIIYTIYVMLTGKGSH